MAAAAIGFLTLSVLGNRRFPLPTFDALLAVLGGSLDVIAERDRVRGAFEGVAGATRYFACFRHSSSKGELTLNDGFRRLGSLRCGLSWRHRFCNRLLSLVALGRWNNILGKRRYRFLVGLFRDALLRSSCLDFLLLQKRTN